MMSPIYQKLIRITLAIPGFWVLILNSTLALPKNSQEVIDSFGIDLSFRTDFDSDRTTVLSILK